jgi:pre-mRNA-splicing helicase BRR2
VQLQVLIANRSKIVWCTKLMRAKSDDETAAIEREMYNDASLMDILGQLKATRASARDRKNAIIDEVKEEARKLRTTDAAESGGKGPEVLDRDVAARQVLDLEALQFEGGGHYLATKSVRLPAETFKRHGKGYEEVCNPPSHLRLHADNPIQPLDRYSVECLEPTYSCVVNTVHGCSLAMFRPSAG